MALQFRLGLLSERWVWFGAGHHHRSVTDGTDLGVAASRDAKPQMDPLKEDDNSEQTLLIGVHPTISSNNLNGNYQLPLRRNSP